MIKSFMIALFIGLISVIATLSYVERKKIEKEIICMDTDKYDAFQSNKNGIVYCFYRSKAYPYRIKGGIIEVNP